MYLGTTLWQLCEEWVETAKLAAGRAVETINEHSPNLDRVKKY